MIFYITSDTTEQVLEASTFKERFTLVARCRQNGYKMKVFHSWNDYIWFKKYIRLTGVDPS